MLAFILNLETTHVSIILSSHATEHLLELGPYLQFCDELNQNEKNNSNDTDIQKG